MEKIIWFLFLTWMAWKDLKIRRVSIRMLAVLGLLGVFFRVGEVSGLFPGLFMMGISLISGGGLGFGDALFFLASVGFLKVEELWMLLLGGIMISSFWGMGLFMKRIWKSAQTKKETIPFLVCIWPAGAWLVWEQWKKEGASLYLPGSLTVEASYVMAIILLSLACLIGVAYDRCREYTAVMTLHYQVERMRGQEEEKEREFASPGWKGQVKKGEKRVTGQAWSEEQLKEIIVELHKPEEFMRKTAAAEEILGLEDGDDG